MKINTNEKKDGILETLGKFSSELNLQDIGKTYDKHFKGFGGKADIEKVYAFIFDVLYEKNLIHAVDWKWSIQDELETIKSAVSDFNYEIRDLKEDEDFKVSCTLIVNNARYELKECNEYDFFDEMNEVLTEIQADKRVLVIEGGTGDTLFYCIVNKDAYYDLTNGEYLPFVIY